MSNIWFCDLETTGLSAKSGDILLCAGFAPLEHAEDADDYVWVGNPDVPDDDGMAITIKEFIMDRPDDSFYWWNGFKFDLPFTLERLRQYDEAVFAHPFQYDLKDQFKEMFPYLDGHLATAMEALGIPFEKTELRLDMNLRCANDVKDIEAWDYLKEHNVADIRGTREVWKKMYGYGSE